MTTIPKSKLNKLKHQLKGRLSLVAKEANVSTATISRVLDGQWENPGIIEKCIQVRDRIIESDSQSNQALAQRI